MDTHKRYPSDLTDKQWQQIKPLIPPPKPGGRPREVEMREVLNATFYLVRSGCSWRMLPNDFPPWGTVHYYYRRFRQEGIWQRINDALREEVRLQEKRKATPSATIIDSQSGKTAEKADGGYAGQLVEWTKRLGRWTSQIIKRSDDVTGFCVLPKRWIVERTFAWLSRYRRLSKDDEALAESSESMVLIAMINLMSRRLAKNGCI